MYSAAMDMNLSTFESHCDQRMGYRTGLQESNEVRLCYCLIAACGAASLGTDHRADVAQWMLEQTLKQPRGTRPHARRPTVQVEPRELDVASQGDTMKEARANLAEAVKLLLEVASPKEIANRLRCETYITKLEVAFG